MEKNEQRDMVLALGLLVSAAAIFGGMATLVILAIVLGDISLMVAALILAVPGIVTATWGKNITEKYIDD